MGKLSSYPLQPNVVGDEGLLATKAGTKGVRVTPDMIIAKHTSETAHGGQGGGAVNTVNNVGPDEAGNVVLSASDIGARSAGVQVPWADINSAMAIRDNGPITTGYEFDFTAATGLNTHYAWIDDNVTVTAAVSDLGNTFTRQMIAFHHTGKKTVTFQNSGPGTGFPDIVVHLNDYGAVAGMDCIDFVQWGAAISIEHINHQIDQLTPGNSKHSDIGGFCIKLTAGEALVRGNIVYMPQGAGGADMTAYMTPTAGTDMPYGTVLDDAAQSDPVWITVSGIGYVLPETGISLLRGYLVYPSTSQAGCAIQANTIAGANHNREIGHVLEDGAQGVAARCVLHFN